MLGFLKGFLLVLGFIEGLYTWLLGNLLAVLYRKLFSWLLGWLLPGLPGRFLSLAGLYTRLFAGLLRLFGRFLGHAGLTEGK